MLDIQGLHDPSRSCMEDNVVSFMSWIHRDYELMYLDSWNFRYHRNRGKLLGERLNEGKDRSQQNLAKYHGVSLVKYDADGEQNFAGIVAEQIGRKTPLLVLGDSFWYSWHSDYQLEHNKSSCLVIGTDPGGEELLCLDPYHSPELCRLPVSQSKIYEYGIFNQQPQQSEPDIYRALVSSLAERRQQSPDMFAQMHDFAFDVAQELDLSSEVASDDIEIECELLNRIKYLIRRRQQYRQLLIYAGRKMHWQMEQHSALLDEMIYRWTRLHKELMRAYCLKSWKQHRVRFADDILTVAGIEKKLGDGLIDFLEDHSDNHETVEG